MSGAQKTKCSHSPLSRTTDIAALVAVSFPQKIMVATIDGKEYSSRLFFVTTQLHVSDRPSNRRWSYAGQRSTYDTVQRARRTLVQLRCGTRETSCEKSQLEL
jgi:hypothetical protein